MSLSLEIILQHPVNNIIWEIYFAYFKLDELIKFIIQVSG